ncbi:MAG: methyl-accepting chemotaxis protein, partial [Spirochaetota bacterium]|nr:methyl-accepting chemotaxis protein [Spirochaetota bacterium]
DQLNALVFDLSKSNNKIIKSFESFEKRSNRIIFISYILSLPVVSLIILIMLIFYYRYFLRETIINFVNILYTINSILYGSEKESELKELNKSLHIDFLPFQIETFISYTTDAINDVKNTLSSLIESINSMSEILNFLSQKADEQSSAASNDLSSVNELSEMMNKISDGSDDQQMNLGLLIVRILDFTKIIENINNNLNVHIDMIDEIFTNAKSGSDYLKKMSDSMSKISESSSQMTEGLSLINDISDRINLLSLNAAIESARAGEHGRGFAVVADEISKLADQTTMSIKEIDSLVKKNDVEIKTGIKNIDNAVDSIISVSEGIGSIKDLMHRAFVMMQDQIKNNYAVSEESKKVKDDASIIYDAINNQKKLVTYLLESIDGIKETSKYFAFLAKSVVNNVQEIRSSAISILRDKEIFKNYTDNESE